MHPGKSARKVLLCEMRLTMSTEIPSETAILFQKWRMPGGLIFSPGANTHNRNFFNFRWNALLDLNFHKICIRAALLTSDMIALLVQIGIGAGSEKNWSMFEVYPPYFGYFLK